VAVRSIGPVNVDLFGRFLGARKHHPALGVAIEIVKGGPFTESRKVGENMFDNSLWTNLEKIASERGLDHPVIVVVDVRARFTEVGDSPRKNEF
jgi:hypothetical protein